MVRPRRLIDLSLVIVLLGVVLGLLAAPVAASTAQLVDVLLPPDCRFPPPSGVCPPRSATVLVYQAERGEANRVSVESKRDELRVTDPAAVIQSGEGCTPIGRHGAICRVPEAGISGVFVDGGDGADTIRSRSATTLMNDGSLTINGGRGDDVLVGGPLGDQLYGGPGADVLRGGAGTDRLYDASPPRPFGSSDLSVFFPPAFEGLAFRPTLVPLAGSGRGSDRFDGGSGRDTISYEGRRADVTLDLANAAPRGGARGERDSVMGVEDALGGAGDDRLLGTGRGNQLDGTQGDDRIVGRGGADSIEGGSGRDVIAAGPGDDSINILYAPSDQGAERVFCGSGSDTMSGISPNDFLNDDCERLVFSSFGERLVAQDVTSLLPLRPRRPRTVLSATLECAPFDVGLPCEVRLELRVHGPARRGGTAPPRGTLLGSSSHAFSLGEQKSVSLELSRTGIRLLRRHGALQAEVSATGAPPYGPTGYTTVLRAP
jgi:hypothetical protein